MSVAVAVLGQGGNLSWGVEIGFLESVRERGYLKGGLR